MKVTNFLLFCFHLGYYVYHEASSPRISGDTCWLVSEHLDPTAGKCDDKLFKLLEFELK